MYKFFSLCSLALMGICLVSSSGFAEEQQTKVTHKLNLSRPAGNPVLEGTVVVKAVALKENSPFLRVQTTDGSIKDYLIETCDETCQKAINACKGGEQCSIRGRVDESALSIMAEFVRVGTTAPSAETKTTKTGQVFTRDTSHPKLGEAWSDPSGMIWGDIVKNKDGSEHLMNQRDATDYCKSIGADLPSKEDFIRLREYMGAKSPGFDGYTPQVLPNLTHTENKAYIRQFWSSSNHLHVSNYYYAMNGANGGFGFDYHTYAAVRCVVARR